jgi:hypothetical protein
MNIETKIRNIRFIGELCKFKIAPAGLVFSCLKVILHAHSYIICVCVCVYFNNFVLLTIWVYALSPRG